MVDPLPRPFVDGHYICTVTIVKCRLTYMSFISHYQRHLIAVANPGDPSLFPGP